MELKIDNINEFARHKSLNRAIYSSMNYDEKKKLKFYLYYVIKIDEDKKDLIWKFLNEPIESEDYMRSVLILNKYGGK
jgi:hypothetical protein